MRRMTPEACLIDHSDATCEDCGAEHVEVGWSHVCRPCWDVAENTYRKRAMTFDGRDATLLYEDSKIIVAPIDHFVGSRLVRTRWFAGLATNEPGAEIQIRCPHTVKGHATTEAAVKCGQAMALRLPGAPKGGRP